MKIIIAGIGKLGEYLAKELVHDGNEVTIIDEKSSSSKDIVNNEDLFYINGNALDANTLKEASSEDTDLLISVMDKDEKNIMCSLLGRKLGVKKTIARIRTPEYSSSINLLKDELGLSMAINPELMTASHIAGILSIPNALDTTSFFKGRIHLISIKVKETSTLNNMSINTLSKKSKANVIICAVEKGNDTIIPKGDTIIKAGDIIHVTGKRNDIYSFLRFANLVGEKNSKIMISGGSNISIYLAKMLTEMGMYVKIIEENVKRCKELSEELPDAMIINGDVSDQNLLYEEHIDEFDSFISLNSIDEENIIHSMFAKSVPVPNVITKINHINLDGIVEKADIDAIVTPHKIASNHIVRYVRAMSNSNNSSCESIYKFDKEKFEILEFNVKKGFDGLNIKLKDLNIKKNVLVVAILRNKEIFFPAGNDMIMKNDTVIIAVDENKNIKDIDDILE